MSQNERVPADQYRTVVTRPDDFDAFWERATGTVGGDSDECDGGVGAATQYARDRSL